MKRTVVLTSLTLSAILALAVYVSAQTQSGLESQSSISGNETHTQNGYESKVEQEARKYLEQFPDSNYAPRVRQLLKEIREIVASEDFRVAQFYASRGNNAGAKRRLKEIIDNYSDFSRLAEAKQLYEALPPK